VPPPILAAKATGRLTIRTDAIVKKITVDPITGKATGVEFIDRVTKETHTVSAKVVVLCASAIESIRLLLNSACSQHPNGIGNSSGLLGRYFMDQCPSMVFGRVPNSKGWELDDSTPPDPFYGPTGGIYIPRFQNLDTITHPKFARGFGIQGTVGRMYVPEDRPSKLGLMGFGEALPNPENRVTLNPKRKDRWGIPIPHIQVSLTQNEHELLRAQTDAIKEMILNSGFEVEFAGSTLGLESSKGAFPEEDPFSRFMFRMNFQQSMNMGAAIHECGGVRMGADPKSSVLNSYNQCWDVKNLFVTDGSSFTSSGTVGPTLTIMAITSRACEFIAQEYKAGGL
jgi:choline dehydrogenase-like flavoprotein